MNAFFETIEPASKSAAVPPEKKKILLVGDNPALRQILCSLLTEDGYLVETAPYGMTGIEKTDATTDLVLLDMNMPLQDGQDTFERLSGKYPWLPIILITARRNQFFPVLAAGVDALLEKPLDLIKLFDTIQTLLEESVEARLSRMTSRPSVFRYIPATYGPAEAADRQNEITCPNSDLSRQTMNECAPGAGHT